MTRNSEIRPDLDQGIDREVISQLRARFLKLNQGRLARAREGLTTRQQSVLALLPVFFHVNHPLLPGYVSSATPAGISHYDPDPEALAEANRLTRSFSYKPRLANAPRPIQGIYLMGSLGTLAQAENSDLDVWICHDPEMNADQRAELQRKCQLLESWADSQGAEVHFFLIDPVRFGRGERDSQVSSEDCGTTQHYLLLDEFYRTAIWLAGRTPIWWLVPVYEETRYTPYTHTLLARRYIRADDTLDLGHLAHIPPGEFIGAGLWQLFKGIESPYKSVLKLLLTEVYASESPAVQCLSLRFKQAVFANRVDLDELDPYMVVYRRIEEYLLARQEPERLELVRRSLYLKINKKLTGLSRQRTFSWQRALLERLTSEWGWDERALTLLDARSHWKVRQVTSERRALVSELNHSYRFLTQFARQQNADSVINKRDLNVLGRRLYAAFERRAGKIELINPGISPDLAEETLTLVQTHQRRETASTHWALFSGSLSAHEWENTAPIKRCRSVLELLAWGYRNGVIDNSTRIALHPGDSDLTEAEVFNLLGAIQHSVVLPLASVDEETLLSAAAPREILVAVNVGVDPLRHHRDLNILMTSERTDSLSYAGTRENLVLTLDQITLNSWNEVHVSRFDGPHALLDCLHSYLSELPARGPAPNLRVRCFCHNRAPAIAQRVEELMQTAQRLLGTQLNYRYLVQVEKHFYALQLRQGRLAQQALDGVPALLDYLGQELPGYSPIYLDSNALQEHELALVLRQGQPESVQIFYRLQENTATLYVLDEHNALWHQRVPFHDEASLLVPLQRFLQSILQRRSALKPMATGPAPSLEILYYQLQPNGPGRARRVEQRPAPDEEFDRPFYDVQAIVGKSATGHVHVTLYCNQREFSQLEYGDHLYLAVAREILEQRQTGARYRCYITDLDLSGLIPEHQASSNPYLRFKGELERALNAVIEHV